MGKSSGALKYTEEQGCLWECTSICEHSVVRIAVRVRYGGVRVRHGHGIAMDKMVLEFMQMGVGWGEWASQVEHSSRGEQGCMWVCTSICARSAVRIPVCVRYGGVMGCHGHGRGGLGVHADGGGVG